MAGRKNFFENEKVMLLFTTSPAGLGHVRVTEALRSGLPENIRSEIIGIEDEGIHFIHRLTSRNRFFRNVFEFVQNNRGPEEVFTSIYKSYLRKKTTDVFTRIEDLVNRRRPKPEVLVIISTHFGLAHKIAEVKSELARSLKMCVMLCVVVTDDSPLKIWGVTGADYIFVPSKETKRSLYSEMVLKTDAVPKIFVSPYPISVKFEKDLPPYDFRERVLQVTPASSKKMGIIVPISGAAVQLKYFSELISYLNGKGDANISVVVRESAYTKSFIKWCEGIPSVEVVADTLDKDVVLSYERTLANGNYSIEITKPSEQSFKALLTPRQRGGVILLFSNPVGRQEYDNINFLVRHGLMPGETDQKILNNLFYYNENREINSDFLKRAESWRGLMLPAEGKVAGRGIYLLKKEGVLMSMMKFSGFPKERELKGNGVAIFWRRLEKRVFTKCSILGIA